MGEPNPPALPPKAVEAMCVSEYGPDYWNGLSDDNRAEIREWMAKRLTAALPALYRQWEAERERAKWTDLTARSARATEGGNDG